MRTRLVRWLAAFTALFVVQFVELLVSSCLSGRAAARAFVDAVHATELAVGDQKERLLARLTKLINKKSCEGEE